MVYNQVQFQIKSGFIMAAAAHLRTALFDENDPTARLYSKDFADCLPACLQKSSHNSMTAFTPYNAICMYKRCANYIMYLMAQEGRFKA